MFELTFASAPPSRCLGIDHLQRIRWTLNVVEVVETVVVVVVVVVDGVVEAVAVVVVVAVLDRVPALVRFSLAHWFVVQFVLSLLLLLLLLLPLAVVVAIDVGWALALGRCPF